jgi:hypothetical protein
MKKSWNYKVVDFTESYKFRWETWVPRGDLLWLLQGMERVISMMEDTLQICERAQCSTRAMSPPGAFPFGLRPPSDVYAHQAVKSPQIQSMQQRPSGNLKPEFRACRNPLDVPCTYHKGAQHTLRGCRLGKKIDRERLPHTTQTSAPLDGGEFQKVRVHVSSNDRTTAQLLSKSNPNTNSRIML